MQPPIQSPKNHALTLTDRAKLSLTGVEDVTGFDEAAITCRTTLGDLVIEGSSLHIVRFSAETGELSVEGGIAALYYQEKKEKPAGGRFGRIFRT